MTITDAQRIESKWLTCGNESAVDFLAAWQSYVNGIDDIIDGDCTKPEDILWIFMQSAFVYTHPFFLANGVALRQLAVNCTSAYADSVAWEKSPEDWKRNFSDHYRHFGAEMVLAVAFICGGYPHMREASLRLREICYLEHHNEKGEAV